MTNQIYSFPFCIDDIVNLLGLSRKKNVRHDHYLVNCPFCLGKNGQPDQHYHMDINTAKNTYHCNRCDAGGGMLTLYAMYYQVTTQTAYQEIMVALSGAESSTSRKSNPAAKQIVFKQPESNLACIEIRDHTYQHLLQNLQLTSKHKDDLLNRGLSAEQIILNGYHSLPAIGLSKIVTQLTKQNCTLQGVPGFYFDNDKWQIDVRYSGLLIPVRDYKQRIQGLQIRRDQYVHSKYNWFTSSDKKNGTPITSCIHIAGLNYAILDKTVYCTEGPLKADIASYLGKKCFIACPGISHYKRFADILPVLKWYDITHIYNAFDMDYKTNPQVAKCIKSVNELFLSAGFAVKQLLWPSSYKGIDDFLLYQLKTCA